MSTPFIELCSKKTVLYLKMNWEFQLSGERKAESQDKVDKKFNTWCLLSSDWIAVLSIRQVCTTEREGRFFFLRANRASS